MASLHLGNLCMSSLSSKIQSLLFASPRPLTLRQIAGNLEAPSEEVERELAGLMESMNTEESGIHLVKHPEGYQLVTNPACAEVVEKLTKDEPGELTRPSLETLTVIAYRGPITRPELEAIRGVQCALILRNLLIRGLIVEREDSLRGENVYTLSGDTLRYLGVYSEKELPDYEAFHGDARLTKLVDALDGL
jgi:segregation and condensation protein B